MILRGMVMSTSLAMETGLTIITPPAGMPGTPDVCYVLHGIYGNHETWATYSMLPVYAQRHNTVFVMPEAARSFYTDMQFGQKFFSYVADELPEIITRAFSVKTGRDNTGIMGGSMGGNGALAIALRRPEQYGRCAVFGSAALFLRPFMESLAAAPDTGAALAGMVGPQLTADFRAIMGPEFRVMPEWDIPALAEAVAGAAVKPTFYAACGLDDAMFREDNARFARHMQGLGFEYAYEELPGGHDFAFFDSAIKRALELRLN